MFSKTYAVLEDTINMLTALIPVKLDVLIYLKVDLVICLQRIKQRNRKEEQNFDLVSKVYSPLDHYYISVVCSHISSDCSAGTKNV